MHITWFALAKEGISSALSVQNYCSYSIFSFRLTLDHTYCLKCHPAPGTLFPVHKIILQNFQVFLFFFILYCVHHTISFLFFFHFALCSSQNTGKLPPSNWYGYNMLASTTLKLEKTHVLLHETKTAFQTVIAAQKWAEMEDKWDQSLDTKIGNYRQRNRLTTEIQDCFWGADRSTKAGESEWVLKVTDKWGQRERGCYSAREQKSRHSG